LSRTDKNDHLPVVVTHVGATPRGCPVASVQDLNLAGASMSAWAKHGARGCAPTVHTMNAGNTGSLSLGDTVHRFKTMATKRYADGVKQSGWRWFPGKLCQRSYWEHIVRNEMELGRIRQYIHTKPIQWESDRLNLGERKTGDPGMIREPVYNYHTEGWVV